MSAKEYHACFACGEEEERGLEGFVCVVFVQVGDAARLVY